MSRKVEYRVIPVTRYMITEWHEEGYAAGSQGFGEFDWERSAYIVANSLGQKAKSENPDWEVSFPEVPEPNKI